MTRTRTEALKTPNPFRGYRVTVVDGCEMEVRSSKGFFYPYDGETIAFACSDNGIARLVRRRWADEVRVFSQGDDETTFLLPVRLYPEVATIAHAPRRS